MLNTRRMHVGALAAALGVTIALAGCSSGGSGGGADGGATGDGEPVTIDYWGWVPGMQTLVDEWNEQNPDIQVNYSAQSAGDDATFSKITTAAQSGDAPDLVQADVKWVTSLLQYAQDVTDEAAQYEDNFTAGAWSNVTLDGVTYGLPQDSGPVVMYYNKAKLDELGVAVPTTWDEFGEAARAVAAAEPGTYLAGFSSDDTENLQSYVQQAGGQWWAIDGDQWVVDVTGEESVKVAEFWQGLVTDGVVSPTKRWDPAFYNELANGKILSVVGAAWQAPLIADNAEATAGDWAVAPAPQWQEGAEVSANNGGSTMLVLEGTEHAEEALEFANWLNTNVDGLLSLGLFPATQGAEIATPENISAYFGGEDVYGLLAQASENIETPWLFPPTYSDLSKELTDGIAAATNGQTTLPEVLETLQQSSLSAFEQADINASPAS
ncbi:ABC transporter substrate-binding protein [Cellulosimicrobium cellulans]|uniref:ABC transporter substrate-binding protein n=1 Tax=Cellulosimicrobium cellulans TaxID=1710 RepID=UPI0036EFF09F